MTAVVKEDLRETYALGYHHGVRTALYSDLTNHERALRLELRLIGHTNRRHRAFALGELRGYRQAADRPGTLR